MNRLFLTICALLLTFSATWNFTGASPGESSRRLLDDDGIIWAYDVTAGLISRENQMQANSIEIGDGEGLGALIDGLQNWFHSAYNTNEGSTLPDADHFLQVDIAGTPAQKIFLTFVGRNGSNHDTWDDVDIYGTNDFTIGEDITSDESSWTLAKQMVDMVSGDESATKYVSSMIDLGASYQFLRFVVRKTTSERTEGTYNRYFWNLDEFQIYQAYEAKDSKTLLTLLVDSIADYHVDVTGGVNPGCSSQELCDAFNQAYTNAQYALTETHTDAEYAAMITSLRQSLNTLLSSRQPLVAGYYKFISAYSGYTTEKAMGANTSDQLNWGTEDSKDPFQLFKITVLSDSSYSIQNIGTGKYVHTIPGTSVHVPLTAEQTTEQLFTLIPYTSQWNIANVANTTRPYHTEGHSNGAGVSGLIVTYAGSSNSPSAWFLRQVTDEALIDSLEGIAPKKVAQSLLSDALAAAQNVRPKTNDYESLITNATDDSEDCQISSNAKEPNEGSFAALLDNNTSTFFHSIYSAAGPSTSHNLQVDLKDKATDKIKFKMIGRSGDYHDFPVDVIVYATNDESLGADASSEDTNWTNICELKDGFPGNVSEATYNSPEIELGQSYRYVRFVMVSTTSGESRVNSISGIPYYNLSEFMIQSCIPAATSEYYTVAGMKEACDKLDALMVSAEEKIANLTCEASDTTALYETIREINALYVDRDALNADLASALNAATTVYDNATETEVKLLVNGDDSDVDNCQFSSNAKEPSEGSYAALIDGDISTFFHSIWSDAGPATNHNLQIDLKNNPVSKFRIEMTSRNSGSPDMPNDIMFYVTNDETLGSDPTSDDASWTQIAEINEGFPAAGAAVKYASPTMELPMAYRYFRFVVIGTSSAKMNEDTSMPFFNLSEMQIYTDLSADRIQCNYNEELKTATEALKALMEDAGTVDEKLLITSEKADALRAATEAVLAQYADTTKLVSVYEGYMANIDNSVVGEGIGFVDSEEAISAFRSGIVAAKATVSATQPTVSSISSAIEGMDAAYKTFMTHVGQIEPNQWYNIVSSSSREYAAGQPIFLSSVSTGGQLKIGGYNLEDVNIETDPYAIWRFVPIEGQEGQYAIQSMGTGQYFGPYRGQGAGLSPLMAHEKTPYQLYYNGNGSFKIQQVGVEDKMDCLKADGTELIVLNYPANGDQQQAWAFNAIDDEEILSIRWWPDNSINIMTLPFELKGKLALNEINPDAVAYDVKSLTITETGTRLELKTKQDIEAGEPFIIVVNDYANFDASVQHPLEFAVPATVTDTSSIVVNGLVGTLEGLTVNKSGMGVFVSSQLSATTSGSTSISGRAGYIDPSRVVNEEGDADLVIEIGDKIDGVSPVTVIDPAETVNVYTIDGKLVKSNVKAAAAKNGLKKGIYVIGKKKMAIR